MEDDTPAPAKKSAKKGGGGRRLLKTFARPSLGSAKKPVLATRRSCKSCGEWVFNGILRTTQSWYNQRRGHSSRDHLPPIRDDAVTVPIKFSKDNVVCDLQLGGHLLSYRHAA
ncbi:hypothetical protein Poly51_61800 [Rubripirellula tenax]|uniref:Uncharacterized protein n=1 Tax=Rubripirellula tenax TaxID=2528015 RepID=A0A5C6E7C8_9BACT|nr:hypothetical protein [Rubripirellula tenax]TWU44465.1 hypothetical protein Poly51_61800 [Rubripirellula tenax]